MKRFPYLRRFRLFLLVSGLLILSAVPGYPQNGGVTFADGPILNVARMSHATATLPGGKVAVCGGHGTGFVPLSTADIWDPATNAFTLYNMKYTHDGGAFAKLADGRYLLAGGSSSSGGVGYTTTAEIFDPNGPSFTATTGPMNYARTNCAAATLTSGKVLVVGSWYDSSAGAYGDLYNPASGTFTATGQLNTGRSHPRVLPTSDGMAIVCGGMGTYGLPYLERVELYDPTTNSFSILQESLLPDETGWLIAGSVDFTNGRSIDTQRLSNGKYLLWAWKGTTYTLVTFDPATKTFAKYIPNPPLPTIGVSLYTPVIDLLRGKAFNLAYVGSYSKPLQARIYTLNLGSGALDIPTGTTPLNHLTNSMGLNLLADGRLFLTGGPTTSDSSANFYPSTKTFFATPMQGGVNLAPLHGVASANATYNGYFPSLAIDDNWETQWAAPAHGTAENPFWLQVDLQKSYKVDQIVLVFGHTGDTGLTNVYNLYTSADGITWNLVHSGTLVDSTDPAVYVTTIPLSANQIIRYAKYEVVGGSHWALMFELEIWGDPIPVPRPHRPIPFPLIRLTYHLDGEFQPGRVRQRTLPQALGERLDVHAIGAGAWDMR